MHLLYVCHVWSVKRTADIWQGLIMEGSYVLLAEIRLVCLVRGRKPLVLGYECCIPVGSPKVLHRHLQGW